MKTLKKLAFDAHAILFIAVLLMGTASSCRSKSDGIVTLIAVDNSYDSQRFHNAMAKLIIENAFEGYELTFSTASTTMNYESMKNGDIDISMETWTDNFATYPDDIRDGIIINVGVVAEDSYQGLYVPRYVIEGDPSRGIAPMAPGLRSVEDLLRYPHVFPDDESPSRGRIYGSIPGWKADMILQSKYHYYGLDQSFNYMRLGSEASLFASLMSAHNLGQAWVGYCYEPTWIAGKLDLVLLEDAPYEPVAFHEGKTAFSSQQLMIISHSSFPAKAPEIYGFLQNFSTGRALISKALAYLDESRASHDEVAVWFAKTHDEMLDDWLPAENARRLREYLSQRP